MFLRTEQLQSFVLGLRQSSLDRIDPASDFYKPGLVNSMRMALDQRRRASLCFRDRSYYLLGTVGGLKMFLHEHSQACGPRLSMSGYQMRDMSFPKLLRDMRQPEEYRTETVPRKSLMECQSKYFLCRELDKILEREAESTIIDWGPKEGFTVSGKNELAPCSVRDRISLHWLREDQEGEWTRIIP